MCENDQEVLEKAPISEAQAVQAETPQPETPLAEAPQTEAQAAQAELASALPVGSDAPAQAPAQAAAPDTVAVVDVQFQTGCKVYYFDPKDFDLKPHDHVIIETARGPEYGICASGVHEVPRSEIVPPLRAVIRKATAADERTVAENKQKEKRAFTICQQKIAEHKLDMQLVSAEYVFDGSKILFFFTADDRVDFRELVRNLASTFRTRIELRQVGVRDKAKMVGGLGICGRPFCCSQFLEDFQPVSIKMAKTQNLSLNPTKISGTCGRLMCCLKYEQAAYEDLIRTSPKADSFVDTPDGRGTVTEVNLLKQSVKVRMEEQPEEVGCYHNCEICVLRNGKAKKNDPPIPANLAPISGNGKRPRVKEQPEEHMTLDPIRFRYRSDEIVPENPEPQDDWTPEAPEPQQAPAEPQAQEPRQQSSRRRRRRSDRPRPEGERPRSEEAGKAAPKKEPSKDGAPRDGGRKNSGPREGDGRKPQQGQSRPRPRRDNRPQGGENRPSDSVQAPDRTPSEKAGGEAGRPQGSGNRRRRSNHRPRNPGQNGSGGSSPATPHNG